MLVFLALLLACSAAKANWQNTTWGMTEQQVQEAMPAVQASSAKGFAPDWAYNRFVAPYTAGEFVFQAYFAFDKKTKGLTQIDLVINKFEKCFDLQRALETRYGKPSKFTQNSVSLEQTWHDEKENNVVRFTRITEVCFLRYQPIKSPSNNGL